ncbi:MAG: response regulator [Lachnospiraceae bacterium]|nr:response regulator [Lachnospiraceae bacterium]
MVISMGRIRILAVDDSAINLAAIEQALKEEYEVIAVNSGSRALQYLKSETPDLILLDIQMTSMDGLETLKEIRAMRGGRSIPVIMLTAKNDKTTFLESTKLGIYDYIVKPFQSEYLHERILRALKRAGVITFTSIELKAELKKLQRDIESDNRKGALLRADEMVNYKVDAMVRQTILKVRERIVAGDANGALSCLNGIL